jgi:hypothetical protein
VHPFFVAFRIKMNCAKHFYIFTITIVLMICSGCSFLLQSSGPVPITVSSNYFLISWDAEEEILSELPSSTSYFNLYYRKLFAKDWIFLKSTYGNKNIVTVNVSELRGNDSYEFGIEQVYKNGRTSEIHGSTDFTAKPAGGWYLIVSN